MVCDAVRFQIGPPAHVVDHLAGGHVVEEAVHGEVAPDGVLLGGAEDVVAGDEQILAGTQVLAHVDRVLAEGGDLDDLAAAEVDVGQPEAPADEAAVPEDGPYLARVGVGGHVEVLGRVAEQEVADAAAHQVGLVAHVPQARDHLERLGIEPLLGDLRRVRGRWPSGRIEREAGRRSPATQVLIGVIWGGKRLAEGNVA